MTPEEIRAFWKRMVANHKPSAEALAAQAKPSARAVRVVKESREKLSRKLIARRKHDDHQARLRRAERAKKLAEAVIHTDARKRAAPWEGRGNRD